MDLEPIRDPWLRDRTAAVFGPPFERRRPLEPRWEKAIASWFEAHEAGLADEPAFRELGLELLASSSSSDARRWGAIVLTSFPDREVVERVALVLDDASADDSLRAQAAWTLGFRRLARRSEAVWFPPESVERADRSLVRAFRAGLHRLPLVRCALRSCAAPELFVAMEADPVVASDCLLAFGSPALARQLLSTVDRQPSERAPAMVRLSASLLGEEALPSLLALSGHPNLALRFEALFAAMAIDPDRAGAAFEALVDSFRFPGDLLARRDHCLRRPGRHPIVEALAVATTSACLPPGARGHRIAEAASILLEAREAKAFVTAGEMDELLLELAFHARGMSPDLLIAAVSQDGSALADDAALAEGYLEALRDAGRYHALVDQAIRLGRTNEAAYALAVHGRPFLALRARLAARLDDERGREAETLALFLAGRPDLVSGDPTPLLASLRPAPEGADPDLVDLRVLAPFAERPRDLDGAAVYVAKDVRDRAALVARLEAAGARLVDAPFVGTHFYVLGDSSDAAVRARLDRVRARPLPSRWVP